MVLFKKDKKSKAGDEKKETKEEFKKVEVPENLVPEESIKQPGKEVTEEVQEIPIEEPEQEELAQDPKTKIRVVKELPEAPVRNYKDEDGSVVSLITTEEALGEILYLLRNK